MSAPATTLAAPGPTGPASGLERSAERAFVETQEVASRADGERAVVGATSSTTAVHGMVVALGGLSLVPFALALARTWIPERRVFFARWRFSHLFAVLALTWAAIVLCANALLHLPTGLPRVVAVQAGTVIGMAVGAAAMWGVARRMDPDGPRSLGLWPGNHGRSIALGLVSYVLCLPALMGTMMLWPWLYGVLGGTFEQQEIVLDLLELRGPALTIMLVLAVLVQPFFEELYFRGFMQPLLVQNLGDRGGVAVTSLFFAGLHGGSAFLPIFALSLVLGGIKLRTQRLSACTAVHALHNAGTAALALFGPLARDLETQRAAHQGLLSLWECWR